MAGRPKKGQTQSCSLQRYKLVTHKQKWTKSIPKVVSNHPIVALHSMAQRVNAMHHLHAVSTGAIACEQLAVQRYNTRMQALRHTKSRHTQ